MSTKQTTESPGQVSGFSLVTVTDCCDTGHPAGAHTHVLFGDECPHGKPTRNACRACGS